MYREDGGEMFTTSSTRRVAVLVPAAAAVLLTGACKSSPGSENKTDEKGAQATASPSAMSSSAVPVDSGVAAKPASVIVREALAALRGAKAVRLKGRMKSGGQMVQLDLRCGHATFAGTIRGPLAGGMRTFEVRQVNGKVYARYDQAWKLAGSAQEAAAHGMFFTTIGFAELMKPSGRVVKGKPTKVGGIPAIGVRYSGSWLYVATTGKPYPLRFGSVKDRRDAVNFTEYAKLFNVTEPTAS
jgi:hypothetical protein